MPNAAWDGEDAESGDAGDQAQFLAIVQDIRRDILQTRQAITQAVGGLVGKEHTEAMETCSREMARTLAMIERLESRPQVDLQGMYEDILRTVQGQPSRRPWWLWASAVTLLVLLGVGIGWASKPQLFLSPVAQVIQRAECPGVKGGK